MSAPFIQLLQPAIFNALSSRCPSLANKVFDDVPENTEMPYVVMREWAETPDDAFAKKGAQVVVTLVFYSSKRGFKESQALAAEAHQVMDVEAYLAVAGHTVVYCNREMFGLYVDEESGDFTRRLAARYRILIMEV